MLQNRIVELENQVETLRVAKSGKVDPPKSGHKPEESEFRVFKGPRRCFGCNEVGHFVANCPKKTTGKTVVKPTKTVQCDFCGKVGHSMKSCWKYKGEDRIGVQVCVFCGEAGHYMIDCPVYKAQGKDVVQKDLKGEKLV